MCSFRNLPWGFNAIQYTVKAGEPCLCQTNHIKYLLPWKKAEPALAVLPSIQQDVGGTAQQKAADPWAESPASSKLAADLHLQAENLQIAVGKTYI